MTELSCRNVLTEELWCRHHDLGLLLQHFTRQTTKPLNTVIGKFLLLLWVESYLPHKAHLLFALSLLLSAMSFHAFSTFPHTFSPSLHMYRIHYRSQTSGGSSTTSEKARVGWSWNHGPRVNVLGPDLQRRSSSTPDPPAQSASLSIYEARRKSSQQYRLSKKVSTSHPAPLDALLPSFS